MSAHHLLRNPLVKICGIAAVLYFSLFANKENPGSLGNKFSKETLKKSFEDAREKSKFIMTNVNAAKDVAKNNPQEEATKQSKIIQESKIISASCGDKVIADYAIYKEDHNIHSVNNMKFTIGSKENWPIEKNIIGMKKGEIKNINILDSLKTDQKINPLPPEANGIQYRITIRQITHSLSPNKYIKISCNE